MAFETVLSSERKYDGRVLNLRVDQVRTPNGLEAIREIVERPGAVAIVAVDAAQRVVLVKQYRHGKQAITIEIPAGVMDDHEESLDAARRELREETGITAERFEHLGRVYSAPGWSTEYIHLYLATGLTPGPTALGPDELIELLRVPLSEAIEMVRAGSIDDAKSGCALLLAQSKAMQ